MNTARKITLLLLAGFASMLAADEAPTPRPPVVEYEIVLETIHKGYDGVLNYTHPRVGIVPRGPARSPMLVLLMLQMNVSGSDMVTQVKEMRTLNLGRTWLGPYEVKPLGFRDDPGGFTVVQGDVWPQWHARSGKLLATGQTVPYHKGADGRMTVFHAGPRHSTYSIYDPVKSVWTPWTALPMPDPERFYSAGAGSTQRVDLPNGDILLPIYIKPKGATDYTAMVVRCQFDGSKLSVVELGDEIALPGARGLTEPSLVSFGGRFFLTLRNDDAAYVCTSRDGLRFDAPRKWTWEDGTDLGSYNTQAHWVTHAEDGLFLVYTRRLSDAPYRKKISGGDTMRPDAPRNGASNDHVFRHRAPVFIAQVDPATLTVMRTTERILMPERGARLGNFGITEVSPDETWITDSEWMQKDRTAARTPGDWIIPVDNPRGADNSVFAARIFWDTPNESAKAKGTTAP